MLKKQQEEFSQSRYKIVFSPGSPMAETLRLAKKVAVSQFPILIQGPTGVGKENLARYIHFESDRRSSPFIDVNCGAIPAELFESELFGHAKGSFTGAVSSRKGVFELAEDGTLFLDEIGELPYFLQSKLLRVLEAHMFRPVGASTPLSFRGRVITATHRNVPSLVKKGLFREDLFYRLAVICLELPSLQQRKYDIPFLIDHFCSLHKKKMCFTEDAVEQLKKQSWQGNIRELKNLVARFAVLTESTVIDSKALQAFLPETATENDCDLDAFANALLDHPGEKDKLALLEQVLITNALRRCNGKKTGAARLLGVNRKVVERYVGKLNDLTSNAEELLRKADSLMQHGNFSAAISILKKYSTGSELAQLSVQDEPALCGIHYRLGICHQRTQGWMNQNALFHYGKATELAQKTGQTDIIESSMFLLWVSHLMALNLTEARIAASELLYYAKFHKNPSLMLEGYVAVANTNFWLGECANTMYVITESGLLDDRISDENIDTIAHKIDFRSLGRMFHGLAAFQLGDFKTAKTDMDSLIAAGEASDLMLKDRCFILQGIAWIGCLLEEWELMEVAAVELKEGSNRQQLAFYTGIGKIFHGNYLALKGKFAEAEEEMTEGFEKYVLYDGGLLFQSFQAWQRGEVLLMQGKAEQCIALLSPSIEIATSHQERAYLAEMMELRARAQLALGNTKRAKREFECALSTAAILSTLPARIRAAAHLKSLYADHSAVTFGFDKEFQKLQESYIPLGIKKYLAMLQ